MGEEVEPPWPYLSPYIKLIKENEKVTLFSAFWANQSRSCSTHGSSNLRTHIQNLAVNTILRGISLCTNATKLYK
ncbi:hypothetical protein AAFF_G00068300 [Aldrovandia affinis]|uniref:Uncharacterized protein n=1 Tax=Aldrovandia affinis TaxID=143900 RepID=A0AAD7WDL7_9TELE|nr:hypothetical protein AAFF_G00068300 [Aldrovandia affinis]